MDTTDARIGYADDLEVQVYTTAELMGAAAAARVARILKACIARQGSARLVVATGASQFTFFEALRNETLDWSKVDAFHLDEYVGIAPDHPASFRGYLRERFVAKVNPRSFNEIAGDAPDADAECARYAALLDESPIDLCVCGIGENGHLAFNDPPVADFNDPKTVKIVELDEACRRQQLGEGWFPTFEDVPTRAMTQTISSMLRARNLVCIVPDARKNAAVKGTIAGEISTACPGSVLRTQPQAVMFLDAAAYGG